jgi:hypothetical protein
MGHQRKEAGGTWLLGGDPEQFDWSFANGADVYDARGERLGYVVAVYPTHLVFTRGLSLTDYVLPLAEIESLDRSALYLRTDKAKALDRSRRAGASTANDDHCLWRHQTTAPITPPAGSSQHRAR